MSEQFNYQVECGECGETLYLKDFETHPCAETREFQAQSTREEESELTREESQSQTVSVESLVESNKNFIGKLAEAVQARPPLWDHTLPLKQRGKDVREKLWKEVHHELGVEMSIENLIKKWTNLRDTFLKHLKTYKPSGSGTSEKKLWRYYENLQFLAGKNMPKTTISNTIEAGTSGDSTKDFVPATSSGSVSPDISTPASKRRKRNSREVDTEEMLLNILKEPPPIFPPQPQLSPALMTVQSVLDKLPAGRRMKLELEFINKVYSEYAEFVESE